MTLNTNWKIPLSRPFLGIEERDAICRVLESKYIGSGQVVREFEAALALKFNRKFCTTVNSGTNALYLALKISGLKKIILPSITCPEVFHAVLNAGAEPVFADVDTETHNIDLSKVYEKQSEGIEGIIVTHAYGHAVDMDELARYLDRFHLFLIEDFAQAMGGSFKGKILGSFGRISVTSFYAGKNMTTGYGGAIFTDDPEVYEKCLYARRDMPYGYYEDIIPLNYKMTDIQAAIGLVQLNKLDMLVDMRRNSAHKLTGLLGKLDLKTPVEKPYAKHAYYKYHIVLPAYVPKREFMTAMAKVGISTGVLYDPPLHKMTLAEKILGPISLPIEEYIAPRTVSLPIFPEITDDEIHQIYHAVGIVLRQHRVNQDLH